MSGFALFLLEQSVPGTGRASATRTNRRRWARPATAKALDCPATATAATPTPATTSSHCTALVEPSATVSARYYRFLAELLPSDPIESRFIDHSYPPKPIFIIFFCKSVTDYQTYVHFVLHTFLRHSSSRYLTWNTKCIFILEDLFRP